MIDLIKFEKKNVPSYEIATIVEKNRLSNNSEAGKPCYSNRKTKFSKQDEGVYIDISTAGNLKFECSLHKYYNETIRKIGRYNYDMFTMKQAKEAINELLEKKHIKPVSVKVKYYEIGVNLSLSKDCLDYLGEMLDIEKQNGKKVEFTHDPNYKEKRMRVTNKHRSVRVWYRAYDKFFEMLDKKRKGVEFVFTIEGNILRIETVYRRVEKHTINTFFSNQNLKRIQKLFFEDWEKLRFEKGVKFPTGTGRAKKELCRNILRYKENELLSKSKKENKTGELSDKEYRNIREFIKNEWITFKKNLIYFQSDVEKEYRKELERVKQIIFNEL